MTVAIVRLIFAGMLLFSIFTFSLSLAQQNSASQSDENSRQRCQAIIDSVADAGFSDTVEVTCDDEVAYLHSNSYPNHPMMTGIIGANEQIPVPTEGYYATVRLDPVLTEEPKTRDSSLAIAVNGIPIFDYTAGGELSTDELHNHQPHLDTLLRNELDECGGHTGRGDDYHYHELPRCMIAQMANAGDDAIIAWGFDGFPVYGNNNPDGSPIADGVLDVCNGQADPEFGYRYHTSEEPPYIVQCIWGVVGDLSTLPRIGTTRPSGRPPRDGVQNLVFTDLGDGKRIMTYDYSGDSYFISYESTESENCYFFEYKTITNGGILETGEHCTSVRIGSDGPGRTP